MLPHARNTHSSTLGCRFPTYKRSLRIGRVCAGVDDDATGAAGSDGVGYERCSRRVSDIEAAFGDMSSVVVVGGERSGEAVAMRSATAAERAMDSVGDEGDSRTCCLWSSALPDALQTPEQSVALSGQFLTGGESPHALLPNLPPGPRPKLCVPPILTRSAS